MKTKKGGKSLNEYRRKRKLDRARTSFSSKGRYRIGQEILELLDEYEEGIMIERIPNKIRAFLHEDRPLRKSEIVWYTKAVILDLEAGRLIERFEGWCGWEKVPYIRLL